MSKTSLLNTTTVLNIRINEYHVKYPNTGEQIDIELLKAKIADGNYDTLRFSMNPLFQEQANKIDMIATFNILIPELKKDINVKSLFHLTEEQSDELLEVYLKQFLPWYTPIKEAIKNPKKQEEVEIENEKVK